MVDAALRAAGHRIGALHLAASGRSRRTVRRSTAGRSTPAMRCAAVARRPRRVDRALRRDGALAGAADLLRSDDGGRVRAVPARRRRGRRLEVGLGGRLDATNVVDAGGDARSPRSRSITSSISAHAARRSPREKAGIIKPGVPVVVGDARAARRCDVIARVARERGAELIRAATARSTVDAARPSGNACRCARRFATTGPSRWPARRPSGRQRAWSRSGCSKLLDAHGIAVPAPAIASRRSRNASWPGRLELRRCPDGREAAARRRAQPGRRGGAGVLSARARRAAAAAGVRRDARQGRRRHAARAAAGRSAAGRDARVERALRRSRDARRAGARDRPGARRSRSRRRRSRRSTAAWRDLAARSSSPDRSFCSATS